jgi:hypothetical protein
MMSVSMHSNSKSGIGPHKQHASEIHSCISSMNDHFTLPRCFQLLNKKSPKWRFLQHTTKVKICETLEEDSKPDAPTSSMLPESQNLMTFAILLVVKTF